MFIKFAGSKINKKSIVFITTYNEQSKNKLENNYICRNSKIIKYLGINSKEVQNIQFEEFKILFKKLKQIQLNGRTTLFMNRKT